MSFDEVIDRIGTASSRWQGRGDTLALTVGDADFRMPAAVRAAIDARLDEGVLGYDSIPDSLVLAIQDRLAERFSWQVEQDALVFLPGIVPGLNLACRAFVPADECVICEAPVYYPFLHTAENSGIRSLLFEPVLRDGRWQFDFDRLQDHARRDDAHLFLLCHPQNPLGRLLSEDELCRIGEICVNNNVVICSDEIHCDLVFDGRRHLPIASLEESIAQHSLTLLSPSKAFGLSGLGGAFAVIPNADLRARFEATGAGVIPNINVVALSAMMAAYSGECDDYLIEEISYLEANRDYLVDALGSMPGLSLTVPEATYFLWIDFRQTGLNDPYAALLEAGVELSEGSRFGGEGFLRLNFATPRSRLEEAVARITSVLAS